MLYRAIALDNVIAGGRFNRSRFAQVLFRQPVREVVRQNSLQQRVSVGVLDEGKTAQAFEIYPNTCILADGREGAIKLMGDHRGAECLAANLLCLGKLSGRFNAFQREALILMDEQKR